MNDSVALLDLKKKAQKQLYKISEETSVNSGRAKALLLLSEGATQEEAAEKTALSLGQIRYWLGRYRANGIDCFPVAVDTKPKKEKKDKPKKAKKADKKAKDKPKKSEKNKKKSKKTKSK
ncbi:helix-turn-helix domain-containing protein [Methylophaga sp.]|jgi:helix-turn-helix protein|uniref:helix-turn-helix domain-containing protein n=1 Tax=Methylophaga sp. TaxID=2024840 RepID=UPI0023B49D85